MPSFQGLASATLVLIMVGAVLGCLIYVEVDRHLQKAEAATPRGLDAVLPGLPPEEVSVGGPTLADLPLDPQELQRREMDLARREDELQRALGDFEARKKKIEARQALEEERIRELEGALAERREELERDRAAFESRVDAVQEPLATREPQADRLVNLSVLALCGAGALTIANAAVAVARRRSPPGALSQLIIDRPHWSPESRASFDDPSAGFDRPARAPRAGRTRLHDDRNDTPISWAALAEGVPVSGAGDGGSGSTGRASETRVH